MKNDTQLPADFLGKSGKLYVRIPRVVVEGTNVYTLQVAIYPSVESYNSRSVKPHYVAISSVADDYLSAVSIDMATLTILVDDQPP